MSTSRHDSFRIGEMFRLLRFNYNKIYQSRNLTFRLIVSDLSWATIHAIVETLNLENIITYSCRVFSYSKEQPEGPGWEDKSWLASCASHTMHRFVRMTKKKVAFDSNEHRSLAFYSFSLLLNCTTLHAAGVIFREIATVFGSETQTEVFKKSLKSVETLISERSQDDVELNSIIKLIYSSKVIFNF